MPNQHILQKKQMLGVSKESITYEKFSVLKVYPCYSLLKVYHRPEYVLEDGYVAQSPASFSTAETEHAPEGHDTMSRDENLRRSLSRTRQLIADYTLCNQFDIFATFTFSDDRHNFDKCYAKMSDWLKSQQKRYGKMNYLIVPEEHKSGAIHFHALLSNYQGSVRPALSPYSGIQISTKAGHKVYNIASYRKGHSTASYINQKDTDYQKVANYLRKYITKETPLTKHKKRFWCSKTLKKPQTIINPDIDTTSHKPIYENEGYTIYKISDTLKTLQQLKNHERIQS